MSKRLVNLTEGMRAIIINEWHRYEAKSDRNFEFQIGQEDWLEINLEGHYYGPISRYDWSTSVVSTRSIYTLFFSNKDDLTLFILAWG